MPESPSHFRQLWDLGYKRLIPIVPPGVPATIPNKTALGKVPGTRGEDGVWHGLQGWNKCAATEADVVNWAAMGAGVGILTGHGLVAVDIDCMDDWWSGRIAAKAFEALGPAPVRYGRRPKRLLLYRLSEPAPYDYVGFATSPGARERVELLTEGRQFVAYGTHPKTGRPYEWPGGCWPLDALSVVTPAALTAFLGQLRAVLPDADSRPPSKPANRESVDQNSLLGDEESLRAAMSAMPNTSRHFPERADYLKVAIALNAATRKLPGLGLELFLDWCEKWEGRNDLDVARKDYESLKPPYGFGAKWLYVTADRMSGGEFDAAPKFFDVIEDGAENPFAERAEGAGGKKKFLKVHLAEAGGSAMETMAKPLIKGLLDQGAMTVLYGESNTGKTFVAMDIAFHVATGLPWAGMRSTQMPVVYVAAEGSAGARKRAAAMMKKYGETAANSKFHYILSPVDLLRPEPDLRPLIEAVMEGGERPGLVVIDTLSRALAGGDENSSTDMGALVKHFDRIRHETGAHLMVVHHAGKDQSRGARGHSLLRAATDTEIEVTEGELNVMKQRDLDKNFAASFKLEPVNLGTDEDGEVVTSCTLKLVRRQKSEINKEPTASEKEVLLALDLAAAGSDTPWSGVTIREITHYLTVNGATTTQSTVKKHMQNMLPKDLVRSVSLGRWARKSTGKLSAEDREEPGIFPVFPPS